MLRTARFGDIAATDVTAEYRATLQRWYDATARHDDGARAAMGDALFEERQHDRLANLAAVDEGLLVRSLYTATS